MVNLQKASREERKHIRFLFAYGILTVSTALVKPVLQGGGNAP